MVFTLHKKNYAHTRPGESTRPSDLRYELGGTHARGADENRPAARSGSFPSYRCRCREVELEDGMRLAAATGGSVSKPLWHEPVLRNRRLIVVLVLHVALAQLDLLTRKIFVRDLA
jgi:hypothetical protein